MKIGIDIRMLVEGKRTGVEEYVINLLLNLFKIDKKNQYKLFLNAFTKPKIDLKNIFNYPNVEICAMAIPNKILNLSFILFNFPKIDRLLNVDLFFAPNIAFYALSPQCKNVITFHDLAFFHFPHFYSFKRRIWHALAQPKKLAQNATQIIAVSHSTKIDLISTYKIPSLKIKVIYSGVAEKFRPEKNLEKLKKVSRKYHLPEKFILFLGALEPRKNLIGLISAFNNFRRKIKESKYKLVIAGPKGWRFKDTFRIAAESSFSQDILFIGSVDEEDKPYVYNLASLFTYPSFYEGFGFPPLEAMACGIPVVTSASSSLPEICGDAAILVDPYNVRELTEALYQGLFDQKLRQTLIKKGIAQAKKFNWVKCAKETLAVFETCLKKL